MPIIRRNSCVYATLGTCYSVWMAVWYAGYIPDSHPHRITSTKCPIYTIVSPDDGHIVALKHVEIDKYTKNKLTMNKLCTMLAFFTRLYRDAQSTIQKILPNSVRAETGHSLTHVLVYSNAPYCKKFYHSSSSNIQPSLMATFQDSQN